MKNFVVTLCLIFCLGWIVHFKPSYIREYDQIKNPLTRPFPDKITIKNFSGLHGGLALFEWQGKKYGIPVNDILFIEEEK